jgi:hypothetical protein
VVNGFTNGRRDHHCLVPVFPNFSGVYVDSAEHHYETMIGWPGSHGITPTGRP